MANSYHTANVTGKKAATFYDIADLQKKIAFSTHIFRTSDNAALKQGVTNVRLWDETITSKFKEKIDQLLEVCLALPNSICSAKQFKENQNSTVS